VVVAALAGDMHALPTSMAAVALRDDHWNVHHLGADMPADELLRFCATHEVSLAVLTVTNPDCRALAEETAEALRRQGTPVIVGAPGRTLDDLLHEARTTARR
jgi:methylmalonyl-CoA mutase cobalamin-binding subunit